ncbi:MAG: hypothetical protein JSU96_18250 [Acidobacteriota bacterium]|nr:MAG: hypothetical protein JSU96_18250 [Acidobacteriota bacterium]
MFVKAMRFFNLGILASILILSIASSMGQITLKNPETVDLRSIGISRPKGITYHPARGTLFIARRGAVFEVSLEGERLNRFDISYMTEDSEGIVYDHRTERLLIVDGTDNVYQVNPDGSRAPRRVFVRLDGNPEAFGITVEPSGAIWVVDRHTEMALRYSRHGRLLWSFSCRDILHSFEDPKGVSYWNGNLLMVDDSGGSQYLYLTSVFGAMRQFVADTTEYGASDPDGVTAVGSDRLCLVSSNDNLLLCFDVEKSLIPQDFVIAPFSVKAPEGFVGLAVVNRIDADNPVEIQALNHEGDTVDRSRLFDPIRGSGQAAFISTEASTVRDLKTLILRGTAGPIQGFSMVGNTSLTHMDAIAGHGDPETEMYFPEIRSSAPSPASGAFFRQAGTTQPSEVTSVFLFNPNTSQSTEVTVEAFDLDGEKVAQGNLELQAYGSFTGRLYEILGDDFELADGYARVTADRPILGSSYIWNDLNAVSFIGRSATTSGTLWAPHFFGGQAPDGTILRVVNLEDRAMSADVYLYADDGSELASSRITIEAKQVFSELLDEIFDFDGLVTGYMKLEIEPRDASTSPGRSVLATLTYLGNSSRTASALRLVAGPEQTADFLQVAQSEVLEIFQGLAIANPNDSEAVVEVQVFDRQGEITASATVIILPGGRVSGLLTDDIWFGDGFEQIGGHIRVTSDQPILAYSLFGNPDYLAAVEGVPHIP